VPRAFRTCAVSIVTESVIFRTAEKETGGPADVAPALWAQPTRPGPVRLVTGRGPRGWPQAGARAAGHRPGPVLLATGRGPCCCPSGSLATGWPAASPAPNKDID
jgi:hypothetical protein